VHGTPVFLALLALLARVIPTRTAPEKKRFNLKIGGLLRIQTGPENVFLSFFYTYVYKYILFPF
jgi:hypothetical protein